VAIIRLNHEKNFSSKKLSETNLNPLLIIVKKNQAINWFQKIRINFGNLESRKVYILFQKFYFILKKKVNI